MAEGALVAAGKLAGLTNRTKGPAAEIHAARPFLFKLDEILLGLR